jgi:hypothetical protein
MFFPIQRKIVAADAKSIVRHCVFIDLDLVVPASHLHSPLILNHLIPEPFKLTNSRGHIFRTVIKVEAKHVVMICETHNLNCEICPGSATGTYKLWLYSAYVNTNVSCNNKATPKHYDTTNFV